MSDKKPKIIIIEDETILIDILRKKLEKEGYEVFSATDGREGLEKIKKVKPDVVLLDIIMPKLNGYEVLEMLGKEYKDKIPAVIIISNSGQPVEIDKAIRLGAKDYIIKAQFTPEEVAVKVNNLLGNQPGGPQKVLNKITDSQGEQGKSATQAKGPNILIVEDDQFLRDLLKTKLEKNRLAKNIKEPRSFYHPGMTDRVDNYKKHR